ncbi:MAG: hypothetical protein GY708_23285 [Actinomycetia bacterium]|nr:hypothetical protein [Actinomycetes bacterium]MCP4958916.1 hypothetical protein [Actinomycetes bacterium]
MNDSHENPRQVALRALLRIDGGERSGPVLADELGTASLDQRDRAFVTNLVQGTTRMQRACDYLLEPHLKRRPDDTVRQLLRVGVFQMVWLNTPPHAAVSATVEAGPRRASGFVNAVLRKVAAGLPYGHSTWPSPAVELSYPDWIVQRLTNDLGSDAIAALRSMNDAERPGPRADGFVQGLASRWVVDEVDVSSGDLVADVCAAPGGKSTGLAAAGATVVAGEIADARIDVLASTLAQYGQNKVMAVRTDAGKPPFRPAAFDRVLIDAPCSGLGALGRRSDARWRARSRDVARLAAVQRRLLAASAELVKPGGVLVFAVCTVTSDETAGVIDNFSDARFEPVPLVYADRWRPLGERSNAGLLLPQDRGTDGMAVVRWQRTS